MGDISDGSYLRWFTERGSISPNGCNCEGSIRRRAVVSECPRAWCRSTAQDEGPTCTRSHSVLRRDNRGRYAQCCDSGGGSDEQNSCHDQDQRFDIWRAEQSSLSPGFHTVGSVVSFTFKLKAVSSQSTLH